MGSIIDELLREKMKIRKAIVWALFLILVVIFAPVLVAFSDAMVAVLGWLKENPAALFR